MDQNEWTAGEVDALLQRLEILEKRIDSLEGKPSTPTPPAVETPPAIASPPPPLPTRIPTPQDDARVAVASAVEQTPVVDIPAAPPRASLEQKIGQQWMLWAGAAIFLLGGIFFLKFAYDKGWIHPPLRCCMTMIAGLAIVVAGKIALRKKYRHYAACLFGIALAMLYYTSWAASPSGWYYPQWSMLSTTQSYLAMCAITALGIGLAVQSRLLSTALIALVGAFLTPVLLSTDAGRQIALYNYVLIVDVGFLLVALLVKPYHNQRRTDLPALLQCWGWVGVVAFIGTVILFLLGMGCGTEDVALKYIWLFYGLFVGTAYVAESRKRFRRPIPEALFIVASVFWMLVWTASTDRSMFLQALVVSQAVAILMQQKVRWLYTRPMLWVALIGVVALRILGNSLFGDEAGDPVERFLYWALLGLWLADVLVRSRRRESINPADSLLAPMIAIFVIFTTLGYIPDPYHGLYLTSIALVFLGVFGLLHHMAASLWIRISYVLQGAVLLFIAVPVQFDGIQTTLGWIGLGMIALLLIRRYALTQLVIAVYAGVLLAMLHFLLVSWPDDPEMFRTMFTCFGQSYSVAIASAYGLAAIGIVCMMSLPDVFKRINPILGLAGLGVLAGVVCKELNFEQATVNLLTAATVGVILLQCLPRLNRSLLTCVIAVLAILFIKWFAFDYLSVTVENAVPVRWCLLNPTWISGMVLMGLFSWLVGLVYSRDRSLCRQPAAMLWLGWAVVLLWSGSFEIHRAISEGYIATDHQEKALQMGLSLYWGVMAMGMLVAGFARRLPPVRYVAIALFVLTVAKVLLVDMADVEAIYRIGTFLGLGALMLGGSLVYHRAFRQ
jgi:uncharacterized membrane protein